MVTFTENWYSSPQLEMLTTAYQLVKNLPGDIIEIGCWEGRSTVALANAAYPEEVIAVDTWEGNCAESRLTGVEHVTEAILRTRDVYSVFLGNIEKGTKSNVAVVRNDCFRWLQSYGGKVKFCHIDASHDYPSVKLTIEGLKQHLLPGAVLCGDDIATAHRNRSDLLGGVERAVQECLPRYERNENFWWWVNIEGAGY